MCAKIGCWTMQLRFKPWLSHFPASTPSASDKDTSDGVTFRWTWWWLNEILMIKPWAQCYIINISSHYVRDLGSHYEGVLFQIHLGWVFDVFEANFLSLKWKHNTHFFSTLQRVFENTNIIFIRLWIFGRYEAVNLRVKRLWYFRVWTIFIWRRGSFPLVS